MTRARGLAGFASAISGPVNSTDLNVGVLTATNVTVGGTITYEDVSNVDSVGIITARAGIRVTGGNVGINETSPGERLQIDGNIRLSSTSQYFKFTAGNSHQSGLLAIDNDSNNRAGVNFQGVASNQTTAITFSTSDTVSTMAERMRIDNEGKIGIGTVTPLQTVHVQGGGIGVYNNDQTKIALLGEDGNLELKRPDGGYIDFGDSISDDYDARIKLESDGELIFSTGGAPTTKRLGITSTGSVGINTDPTELFEILLSDSTGSRIHTDLAGSGNKFTSWVIDAGISQNDSRSEVDFNHGGTSYGTLYTSYNTSSNTATSLTLRSLSSDTHITISPDSTARAQFATDGALYLGTTIGNGASADAGVVKARGYNCKQGYGNGITGNQFNIHWTGSVPQLWIDTTNVGTISVSSDYRVKDNVVSITSTCIDRIKQLRPVQYEYTNYGDLFTADGVTREGFIAHEVQEVIPSGAAGVKDDPNEIQSLKVDAILSVTVKALQEAIAKIETLETKVAALEGN